MPESARRIQSVETRRRPTPEPVPLVVLFEDNWVIAVNKPVGQVVHPTYKNTSGTVLNGLLWRVAGRDGAQPGIVTRLDKDTSGIVLAGLTGDAHARIQKDMSAGRVRKEYLAIVRGVPDPQAGAIVLPLARDPEDRRRVVVDGGGAYCETRYDVVTVIPERSWSLVRCRLVTGRTHQIRVHLAERGWPLVGDPVYGAASDRIARQALHAWRVTFPHPASGELVTIEAPLPADMAALLPQNLTL